MIKIVYPERRYISEDKLISWAKDCYFNADTDELAETLGDAVRVLENLGYITVGKEDNKDAEL